MKAIIFGISLLFLFFFPDEVLAVTFSISSDQKTISKDDEVSLQISISDITSCTKCFLQSAFTTSLDSHKYLGFTQNNSGSWNKYISSPAPSTIQSAFFSFEPTNNNWSGTMKAKIDPSDSDYKGSGTYYLKVLRYTGNSSSGYWSDNTVQLTVLDTTPTNTPTPSPTPVPSSTPKPSPTTKPSATSKPTTNNSPTTASKTISLASIPPLYNKILEGSSTGPLASLPAEVLGENISSISSPIAPSSKPTSEPEKKEVKVLSANNFLFIIIGGILLAICAILGVWKYIKRDQDASSE